ncbi:hypothetical protein SASPL_107167 [Salvia splendens]|uniref:FAE domain-containing protein n=1 Tax=Salvia splendens TaxID=180675 RepID=A0A8X8YAW0_SALSN|nr:3-ketoacyl-CoA synthase 9-like [Salvia splendens]KAG6429128.1 hypothetical protein SASPL_107167 [Salvia splendens]
MVSTENLTSAVYTKVILNCLFRSGGSAVLFSNKPSHRRRSNYELLHAVHTHTASSDVAYNCIFKEEDSDNTTGITVTRNLLIAATSAIEHNLAKLGFLILPLLEKLLVAINLMKMKPYIPKSSDVRSILFLTWAGCEEKLGAEPYSMWVLGGP